MSTIDDVNYARDPRNCGRCPERVYIYDDEGIERELPTRWEVCDVCDGRGHHVNPSIDAGGLSAEDFADDPDFREAYFRGDYDQRCNRCGGRTTIRVVDRDACEPELLAAYDADLEAQARDDAERLAEIRMGA